MSVVLVIGGGAAGMAAAIASAGCGHEVHLLEKNEKTGKKLYLTGKGRCNVTNACDMESLLNNVVSNPRFLYSSFSGFTNRDMMELLERNGCPVKTERGERVFPVSDKSSDVIRALVRQMKDLGVHVHLGVKAERILVENGAVRGVSTDSRGHAFTAGDAVIVATGGMSYASTGSDGDGYRFARECGHTVTDLLPALVPLVVREEAEAGSLQGLSLRNVEASVTDGGKEIFREFGELLFTHFGISGPLVLSASSYAAKRLKERPLTLAIDLKPALSERQLDERVLRDFAECSGKQFKNALGRLYPAKLIPVIIARSGVDPEKPIREVTKEERQRLVSVTKQFTWTLTGSRGFREAVITQGGVSVKEITPATMESKKVKGLYFAGEVLDLDALTGGFNLQIAWSTGWAAGSHIP